MVKKRRSGIGIWFFVVLFTAIALYFTAGDRLKYENLPYSDLVMELKDNNISELVVEGENVKAVKKQGEKISFYKSRIPSFDTFEKDVGEDILKSIEAGTLEYTAVEESMPITSIIFPIIISEFFTASVNLSQIIIFSFPFNSSAFSTP